jgi:hypothetical protein
VDRAGWALRQSPTALMRGESESLYRGRPIRELRAAFGRGHINRRRGKKWKIHRDAEENLRDIEHLCRIFGILHVPNTAHSIAR